MKIYRVKIKRIDPRDYELVYEYIYVKSKNKKDIIDELPTAYKGREINIITIYFCPIRTFNAWLYNIAFNLIIKHLN